MHEIISSKNAEEKLSEIFNTLRHQYQYTPLTPIEKAVLTEIDPKTTDPHISDHTRDWLHTNKIVPFKEKHITHYQQLSTKYTQKNPLFLKNTTNPNWPIIFALKDDLTEKLLSVLPQTQIPLDGIELNNLTDDTTEATNNRVILWEKLGEHLNQRQLPQIQHHTSQAYRYLIALKSLNTLDPTEGSFPPIIKLFDGKDKNAQYFAEWLSAIYILSRTATKNDVYGTAEKLTDEEIRAVFLNQIVQVLYDCYRGYNAPELLSLQKEQYCKPSSPSCEPGSIGRAAKVFFHYAKDLSITSPFTPSFSSMTEIRIEEAIVDSIKETLISDLPQTIDLLLTIDTIVGGDLVENFPLRKFFIWADCSSQDYSAQKSNEIVEQVTKNLLDTWTCDLSHKDKTEALKKHFEETKRLVQIIFHHSIQKFNAERFNSSQSIPLSGRVFDQFQHIGLSVLFNHSAQKKQQNIQEALKANPNYFLNEDVSYFLKLIEIPGLLRSYLKHNGFQDTVTLINTIKTKISKKQLLSLWSELILSSRSEEINHLEEGHKAFLLTTLFDSIDPKKTKKIYFKNQLINGLSIRNFLKLLEELAINRGIEWLDVNMIPFLKTLIDKAFQDRSYHALNEMMKKLLPKKEDGQRVTEDPKHVREFIRQTVIDRAITQLKQEAASGHNYLLVFLLTYPRSAPHQICPTLNEKIVDQFMEGSLELPDLINILSDARLSYNTQLTTDNLRRDSKFQLLREFLFSFAGTPTKGENEVFVKAFLQHIATDQFRPEFVYCVVLLFDMINLNIKLPAYHTFLTLCSKLFLNPHESSITTNQSLSILEKILLTEQHRFPLSNEDHKILNEQFIDIIKQQLVPQNDPLKKEQSNAILRFLLLDKTHTPTLQGIFKEAGLALQEILKNSSPDQFNEFLVNQPNIIACAASLFKDDVNKQPSILKYLQETPAIDFLDWINVFSEFSENQTPEFQITVKNIFYKRYIEFITQRDTAGKLLILTVPFEQLQRIEPVFEHIPFFNDQEITLFLDRYTKEIKTELMGNRLSILQYLLSYSHTKNSQIFSPIYCRKMIGSALNELTTEQFMYIFKNVENPREPNGLFTQSNRLSIAHLDSLQDICLYEKAFSLKQDAQEKILAYLQNESHSIQLNDWITFLSILLNPEYQASAKIQEETKKTFNKLYQVLLDNKDFSQLSQLQKIVADFSESNSTIMNALIHDNLMERLRSEVEEQKSFALLKHLLNSRSLDVEQSVPLLSNLDEQIHTVLNNLDIDHLIPILENIEENIPGHVNPIIASNTTFTDQEIHQLREICLTLSLAKQHQLLEYLANSPSVSIFKWTPYFISLITNHPDSEISEFAEKLFYTLYIQLLKSKSFNGFTHFSNFYEEHFLRLTNGKIRSKKYSIETMQILSNQQDEALYQVLKEEVQNNGLSFLIQLSSSKEPNIQQAVKSFLQQLEKKSSLHIANIIEHPTFLSSPLFPVFQKASLSFGSEIKYFLLKHFIETNQVDNSTLFKYAFDILHSLSEPAEKHYQKVQTHIVNLYEKLLLTKEYSSLYWILQDIWKNNDTSKEALLPLMIEKMLNVFTQEFETNSLTFLEFLIAFKQEGKALGFDRSKVIPLCLNQLTVVQLSHLFAHPRLTSGMRRKNQQRCIKYLFCADAIPDRIDSILQAFKNLPINLQLQYTEYFAQFAEDYDLSIPSTFLKQRSIEWIDQLFLEFLKRKEYDNIHTLNLTINQNYSSVLSHSNYQERQIKSIQAIILEELINNDYSMVDYLLAPHSRSILLDYNNNLNDVMQNQAILGACLNLMSGIELLSLITQSQLADDQNTQQRKKLRDLYLHLPKTQQIEFLKALMGNRSVVTEEWMTYLYTLKSSKNPHSDLKQIIKEALCTLYIKDMKNIDDEEKGKIFKNIWEEKNNQPKILKDLQTFTALLNENDEALLRRYNTSKKELTSFLKKWFQIIGQSYGVQNPQDAFLIESAIQKAYNTAYRNDDTLFCSLCLSIFKLKPANFKIFPYKWEDHQIDSVSTNIKSHYSKVQMIVHRYEETYQDVHQDDHQAQENNSSDLNFLQDLFSGLCQNPNHAQVTTNANQFSAMGYLIQMAPHQTPDDAPKSFDDCKKTHYQSKKTQNKAFINFFKEKVLNLLNDSRKFQENHLTTHTVSPAQKIIAQITSSLEKDLRMFFNTLDKTLKQENPDFANTPNPRLENAFNNVEIAKQKFEKILCDAEKDLIHLLTTQKKELKAFSSQKDWSLTSVIASTFLLIFTAGFGIFYILDKIAKKEPIFELNYADHANRKIRELRRCKAHFFSHWQVMTPEGKRFQPANPPEKTHSASIFLKF